MAASPSGSKPKRNLVTRRNLRERRDRSLSPMLGCHLGRSKSFLCCDRLSANMRVFVNRSSLGWRRSPQIRAHLVSLFEIPVRGKQRTLTCLVEARKTTPVFCQDTIDLMLLSSDIVGAGNAHLHPLDVHQLNSGCNLLQPHDLGKITVVASVVAVIGSIRWRSVSSPHLIFSFCI